MTAIVGIKEGDKVWIGGDSAGSAGHSIQTRSDPKVFINGEVIIGYTSSFRMGQLLEYEFTPPTRMEGDSGMSYMVRRFIPAVKDCLSRGGYESNHSGKETGGTFLVGYGGEIYEVQNDYQVARVVQGYHAIGCGEDLALGSLHSTDCFDLNAEERINMALEAASEFSSWVSGPFCIKSK